MEFKFSLKKARLLKNKCWLNIHFRKENILGWSNVRVFDFYDLKDTGEGKKSVEFFPYKCNFVETVKVINMWVIQSCKPDLPIYMTIHTWTLNGNHAVGCLSWKDFFFFNIIFTMYIYFYRKFCLFLLFSRKANREKLTSLSSSGKVIKGLDSLV